MKKKIKPISIIISICVLFFVVLLLIKISFIAYDKYKIYQQSKLYYGCVDEEMKSTMISDAEYLEVKNLRKINEDDEYETESKYIENITKKLIAVSHNSDGKINNDIEVYFEDINIFSRLDHYYKYLDKNEMVVIHTEKKALVVCGYCQKERIYYKKINDKWVITDFYIHI